MTENRPRSISKKLSANDIGANGSHQAGILVPKDREILSFFPDLGCFEKNPRAVIEFADASGKTWNSPLFITTISSLTNMEQEMSIALPE